MTTILQYHNPNTNSKELTELVGSHYYEGEKMDLTDEHGNLLHLKVLSIFNIVNLETCENKRVVNLISR